MFLLSALLYDSSEKLFKTETEYDNDNGPRKQIRCFKVHLRIIYLASDGVGREAQYFRRYTYLPSEAHRCDCRGYEIRLHGRDVYELHGLDPSETEDFCDFEKLFVCLRYALFQVHIYDRRNKKRRDEHGDICIAQPQHHKNDKGGDGCRAEYAYEGGYDRVRDIEEGREHGEYRPEYAAEDKARKHAQKGYARFDPESAAGH